MHGSIHTKNISRYFQLLLFYCEIQAKIQQTVWTAVMCIIWGTNTRMGAWPWIVVMAVYNGHIGYIILLDPYVHLSPNSFWRTFLCGIVQDESTKNVVFLRVPISQEEHFRFCPTEHHYGFEYKTMYFIWESVIPGQFPKPNLLMGVRTESIV